MTEGVMDIENAPAALDPLGKQLLYRCRQRVRQRR
jgi:hypothetical protein